MERAVEIVIRVHQIQSYPLENKYLDDDEGRMMEAPSSCNRLAAVTRMCHTSRVLRIQRDQRVLSLDFTILARCRR